MSKLFRSKLKSKLKVFVSRTKHGGMMVINKIRSIKISSILGKFNKKKLLFRLMVSSNSAVGACFPLLMPNMSKPQIHQFPLETQARIERVVFQPLPQVTPEEPEIKLVAPENLKRENKSFAETKESSTVLVMQRGGGSEEVPDFLENMRLQALLPENKKKIELIEKHMDNPVIKEIIDEKPKSEKTPISEKTSSKVSGNSFVGGIISGIREAVQEFVIEVVKEKVKVILEKLKKTDFKSVKEFIVKRDDDSITSTRKMVAELKESSNKRNPGSVGVQDAKRDIPLVDSFFTMPAESGEEDGIEKVKVSSRIRASEILLYEAASCFRRSENTKDFQDLVDQYRTGNLDPGIRVKRVRGTSLSRLKAKSGARVYFRKKNGIMQVVAVADKTNRSTVTEELKLKYPEKK